MAVATPAPPSPNNGLTTTGQPISSAARSACSVVVTTAACGMGSPASSNVWSVFSLFLATAAASALVLPVQVKSNRCACLPHPI
jgi:hypothetical protein